MPIEMTKLRFAKLSENAHSPTRGSNKAAGFDLKSAYNYTVPARGKEIVATDIQIELPTGCYGRIAPRSGLAAKNGIDVGAGVVDEDYRGNLKVVLFNHSDVPFQVTKGDRIAQLICQKIFYPELEECTTLNEEMLGLVLRVPSERSVTESGHFSPRYTKVYPLPTTSVFTLFFVHTFNVML